MAGPTHRLDLTTAPNDHHGTPVRLTLRSQRIDQANDLTVALIEGVGLPGHMEVELLGERRLIDRLFVFASVRHLLIEPTLGVAHPFWIARRFQIGRQTASAPERYSRCQKPCFIFAFCQYHAHLVVWPSSTGALQQGRPQLGRASIVGIQQHQDSGAAPAVTRSLLNYLLYAPAFTNLSRPIRLLTRISG